MPPAAYWELRVAVGDAISEGLTNFVWELGALGVVEEGAPGPDAPRLRAFFPGALSGAAVAGRVRDYLEGLRALGFPVAGEPSVAPVDDEDWGSAWRAHFAPLPVGRRLVVAPPWALPDRDGRLVLVIEPGRAFGTGHHGSTRGCLEALEARLDRARPGSVLDLGTGSGILAVAAARLGVAAVLAVDADPDAIAAATANAAANGIGDRVRCLLGDVAAVEVGPADLVLANLLTAAHLRLGPRYRALVAPGGTLVLGGILEAEADQVATAVAACGFARAAVRLADGWATLEMAREPVRGAGATLHARA
jgi:ribosomal protein L11 methyltransferase